MGKGERIKERDKVSGFKWKQIIQKSGMKTKQTKWLKVQRIPFKERKNKTLLFDVVTKGRKNIKRR